MSSLEHLSSCTEPRKSISLTTQKISVKSNRLSPWFIFSEAVAKYPSHRAIWYEGQVLTYAELHNQAAQLAQWMLSAGMQPGELVGMYMTNKPEFMVIWLAALCIGSAPAFINYNLEGKSLLHCLDVCASKILFVDENMECQARIELSRLAIERAGTRIVVFDDLLKQEVASSSKFVPGDEFRAHVKPEFPICLCYTRYLNMITIGCPLTDITKVAQQVSQKDVRSPPQGHCSLAATMNLLLEPKPAQEVIVGTTACQCIMVPAPSLRYISCLEV